MLRDPGLGDMRRIGQAAVLLAFVLTMGDLLAAPSALAQSYGWGFYREPVRHRYLPRRRVVKQKGAPPVARPPSEPAQQAEVPLPVPRPHFPGDAPASAEAPIEAAPVLPKVSPEPKAVETPAAPRIPPNPGGTDTEPRAARTKPLYGPFKPTPAVEQPPKVAETPAPAPPTSPPLPPPKPPEITQPGTAPGVAPSGARLGEALGKPEDDATCQDRIKARGVEAEPTEIGPQPDPRCTVVRAVRLNGLTLRDGSKVSFPERPTIACPLADAFSLYIRDLLSPLAKGTYGAAITSVWTGPGLECRSRDHIQGAKLSAHGQGLAVDIAQLKLTDGRMFEVGRPKAETDQGFETAARAGACGYFHTALGPGTDAFHATHWHFDIEVRGAHGDSKYCK